MNYVDTALAKLCRRRSEEDEEEDISFCCFVVVSVRWKQTMSEKNKHVELNTRLLAFVVYIG